MRTVTVVAVAVMLCSVPAESQEIAGTEQGTFAVESGAYIDGVTTPWEFEAARNGRLAENGAETYGTQDYGTTYIGSSAMQILGDTQTAMTVTGNRSRAAETNSAFVFSPEVPREPGSRDSQSGATMLRRQDICRSVSGSTT